MITVQNMKNKIIIIAWIFILEISTKSCGQDSRNIDIKLPYSTLTSMEKYLGKDLTKKYFFPDNTEITNYLFEKKYFSLKKNENLVLGSFTNKEFKYITYLRFPEDDYSSNIYEQWIKSYNSNDEVIDSLQIVFYTSYEGISQRMISTINTTERIEILHHRLEWDSEKDTPFDFSKIKTIKGYFAIIKGHFKFQDMPSTGVFFNGYRYGDIYSQINTTCETVANSKVLDINNDGTSDVIYFINSKKNANCNGFSNKTIVCYADKHGLLQFKEDEDFDWDNKICKVTSIKSNSGAILINIMGKKSQNKYILTGVADKQHLVIKKIEKIIDKTSTSIFDGNGSAFLREVEGIIKKYEEQNIK